MGGESYVVDAPPPGTRTSSFRHINAGLLFLFSIAPFPPGTNYMYMGLIKRGLAAMCGFFLLVYAATVSWLFALAIPVLWLTVFFDGFHLRRKINAGERVDDGVGDVLGSILRNKTFAIVILIIIALAFLSFVIELISRIIVPIIVIFALYIIFKKK
jgi:hypothetical protein